MLQRVCKISGTPFTVYPEDIQFYEKVAPQIGQSRFALPLPLLCPEERQRRRISFRNERKLYHRKCDLTGKEIISVYSPDKPYTVYDQREWWSDRWDGTSYGRDFNSSLSFFEQFNQLLLVVPRVALLNRNSENCEYTNISADNKNCYILIESSNNQDCHYSYWMQKCKDCIDCAFSYLCELGYELACCINCYNCAYCSDCRDCSDSRFLKNCIGCRNCFGCINLTQKQYWMFNQPLSRQEYERRLAELEPGKQNTTKKIFEQVRTLHLLHPQRYSQILNSENCSGSYIADSQNCFHCFHAHDARDCRYSVHVWFNARDNMDVDTAGRNAEMIFESINSGIDVYHNLYCMTCWTSHDLLYCDSCQHCQNCFGCVGLRHKQYCVFNKQYTQEEYQLLCTRVIAHIQKTGEWGQFFPPSLSFFGYNETVAQDYFPLTKSQAVDLGFKWYDQDNSSRYQGQRFELPDDIQNAGNDITKGIYCCEVSAKPYRIIPQELSFYKKCGLPLPLRSPDQRHLDRISGRNPRRLWERTCDRCGFAILSSYSTQASEIVYCDSCFAQVAQ